jgi:2-polyprenyl-6-methoxyphenol hydroxylase-like FAD-dependent oxidoreductase
MVNRSPFSRAHYDVLVVGARCAGAAAAMLMARCGLKVLVIDRGRYGADTISTHALMRGGVMQLHRWGLLPRIVAAGTPAVRTTEFHYGEDVVQVEIRPQHGVDALYAPRRTLLDSTLVDAARAAGAEVRHSCTLAALIRRPDDRVSGAVILDDDGQPVEVTSDLVVGADGIGSAVARLADARAQWEGRHATAVVYGHCRGLRAAGYTWYYREGISAGVIPTSGGAHCVFVAVPPARFRAEMRHDVAAGYRRTLAAVSAPLAADIAASRIEGQLAIFAGRRGFLREAWGPGWALVGDAGYFKDPLTAHGMTDALRDAELLASAAEQGSPTAFAEYAAQREELSHTLFEVTDAIASFDWNLDTLRLRHFELNTAMKHEAEHIARLRPLGTDSRYWQEKAA